MIDQRHLVCDKELVKLLYYVLLGRDPESGDIWIGAPLSEIARVVIASDEFSAIAEASNARTFSDPMSQKSRQVRSGVARKLANLGAPPPRTTAWYDLLLSSLKWLKPVLPEELITDVADPLIQSIELGFVGVVDVEDVLDRLLEFDADWFALANKGVVRGQAMDADQLNKVVVQSVIDGQAEPFSHFTISGTDKAALRKTIFGEADGHTLASMTEKMRKAIERGDVDHYLFDEEYYHQVRTELLRERPEETWEFLPNSYLDFIINGANRRIRPHPLYCFTAYETLNPSTVGESEPFSHYVTYGQLHGYRTSALFEPDFYTSMSPLVLLDVANGRFRTTLESFCREGKKEGCAFSPDFDASFYIASNRLRLEENALTSASAGWHFLTVGAASGLQSSPYFDPSYYLQRYPGVAETCRQLGISPIEDFVMFGKNEARKPGRPLADRHVDIFQAKAIYERRALDSLIRLSNYPLDFTDFCGDDPILSVVVPVHNLASFTARFLELAYYSCAELKRRTGANSEIVIVSNGSDDTTDQVLKTMRGVRSLISAEAMGFTRAANWGAEGASGRYLLIANNDIEFAPGTFADLISSFESTANCGVLGARILSMDMTIQEMGAFVARDGTTGGIERGSRSTHHYGCRKRAVDYVSGCFLCIQRADFEAVGGFDEAFSPGYYEEVDLCLRIAETMGKQILVDPTLSIQHYENASFTSGRPPAALYPLVLRNRHTIMRKHPSISRGPSLNQLLGGAAGGASARRTKMLVILDTIPDSRPESSSARNAVILSIFRELEIPYDLLALRPASEVDDYAFPDVAVYRAWMPSESVWDLLNGEIGAYSHIWVGGTGNLNNLVDHLHRYKNLHHARIICDSEMIRFPQSEGAPASTEEQPVDPAEIDLVTAQFSRAAVADHLVTTTEHQASLIRSVGFDSVSVVGHRASIISDGVGEESLVKQVQGVLQETGAWADEPCTA